MKRLIEKADGFDIDLEIRGKYTLVCGDSGTGKSFLAKLLKGVNNDKLSVMNYADLITDRETNRRIEDIKSSKDTLFVIDQADDLLNKKEFMNTIINDGKNQFVLIGRRNYVGCNLSNIASVKIDADAKKITFKFASLPANWSDEYDTRSN